MNQQSATEFAAWLAQNEPDLFAALTREAATKSARLNGVMDFLSSAWGNVSDAVSNVGSYLTSGDGLNNLVKLGGAYIQGQTQQNVMQTQLAMARSGFSPLPISNQIGANGQTVPVYQPTGQPVSNQMLSQLAPGGLGSYAIPIAIGGGLLLLALLLKR